MEKEIEEKIKKILENGNKINYNKVIKICNKILIKDKDKIAFFYRGLYNYNLGEYKEAIKDYGEAIKLDSKYSAAYNNRGLSKAKLGRYKEAI